MVDEAKAQIGFQQVGLGGILRQYRLVVPPHQREYRWTEDEVMTLFQDFAKVILFTTEYFLGTIVTIPRSPEVLEIIDGQQRLATTAILLSQIRTYLSPTEPLIAESITNGFLTEIDRERRARVSKLQLNLDDNEYFRALITGNSIDAAPEPTRSSHRLILDAFKKARLQVRNIVSGFDVKDHGDTLNKWLWFIEYHAQVVLLKVPNRANAYKMFETLNDRGLKITQSDLVKSYLFGEAGDRINEAMNKWSSIRGLLESLEEEDITVLFLRHSLIAMYGFLKEEDVYETVQTKAKGPQLSITILNQLNALAAAYIAIFNPESERWNSYPDVLRRAIQTLNLFNIKPMRPLMLAIATKFAPNDAADAYRILISVSVRLVIASSTRSGSVEQPLAAFAAATFSGEIKSSSELRARLATMTPNDEQFRLAFETATVSKTVLARYYLRSLEMAQKREPTPWFIPNDDQQTINLEHVLPTRPDDSWRNFDQETAHAYVNRLGNQCLLLAKSNSDLKSTNFVTKQAVYKETPYELTRQISDLPEWSRERIAERQRALAKLALTTWPL